MSGCVLICYFIVRTDMMTDDPFMLVFTLYDFARHDFFSLGSTTVAFLTCD
jgi:hypothetical protein